MQEVASNAPNTSYRSNLRFQRGDRRRIFLDFYSIVPRRHTRICRKTTSQREKWPSRESGVEKHLYGEIKGITSELAPRDSSDLGSAASSESHDIKVESYKVDISIAVLRAVECLSASLSSSRSNWFSLFAFPRSCRQSLARFRTLLTGLHRDHIPGLALGTPVPTRRAAARVSEAWGVSPFSRTSL